MNLKADLKLALAVAVGAAIVLWWEYQHNGCSSCQQKMTQLKGGSRFGSMAPGNGSGVWPVVTGSGVA